MNFLLNVAKEDYGSQIIKTKGFSETILFGLEIVLIGMLTVFLVLILLWIALILFKIFFHDIPSGKKKELAKPEPVTAPAPVSVRAADEEIVAVIAAAIAMAEAESGGIKFRVVSFKRK